VLPVARPMSIPLRRSVPATRPSTRRCYAQAIVSHDGPSSIRTAQPRHATSSRALAYLPPLKPATLHARHPYLRPQFASAQPLRDPTTVGSERFSELPSLLARAHFTTRSFPDTSSAPPPLYTLGFSQMVGMLCVYVLLSIYWLFVVWFVIFCLWLSWRLLSRSNSTKMKAARDTKPQVNATSALVANAVVSAAPIAGALQEEAVLARVAEVTARIARFIV